MGNLRKPTETKRKEGTARKDRANPSEPEPRGLMGPAPEYLGEYGRAMWEDLAPRLDTIRVTGADDRYAFERLCNTWDLIRELEKTIKLKGILTEEGKKRPEMIILRDANTQFFNLIGRFGLTPADRPKVSAHAGETVGDTRKPALRIG